MVRNAIEMRLIEEFIGFESLRTEIKIDDSRIDFELIFSDLAVREGVSEMKKRKRTKSQPSEIFISNRMLIEVKSVTLAGRTLDSEVHGLIAEFPDSVSTRATKHANTLTTHVLSGGKAAIFFLIQRADVTSFTISSLDPNYQKAVRAASAAGVSILPYKCHLCPDTGDVTLLGKVPYIESFMP